jgi:hypothetical protein
MRWLGGHATSLPPAGGLRPRAGACFRRDLGRLLRLLGARAERRAELAGHSIFALVLFGLPPVAYLTLTGFWPVAHQVLRHTVVGQVAVAFAATSEAGAWLALRRAARWVE